MKLIKYILIKFSISAGFLPIYRAISDIKSLTDIVDEMFLNQKLNIKIIINF